MFCHIAWQLVVRFDELDAFERKEAHLEGFLFAAPPGTLLLGRHVYDRDHVAHFQADLVKTLRHIALVDNRRRHTRYVYWRVVDRI